MIVSVLHITAVVISHHLGPVIPGVDILDINRSLGNDGAKLKDYPIMH
jgi:hypothetical protein